MLEFGSYQTAWAWLHKLRRAMVLPGRELLSGVVEVDESYVGARRTGAGGRRAAGKAIVAIAVEGDHVPERVRMRRIPNVTKDTLTGFVLHHVVRGSEVRTDGWQATSTSDATASATLSPTCQPAATPLMWLYRTCIWCPRCFSADILGTTQGAISHFQLDYYLDEFTFRFNRRHARHRGLLSYRLLEGALAADPHPYATLIARRQAA